MKWLSAQQRSPRGNSTYPRLHLRPRTRVLPTERRAGDRLVDETGEWEVIGRPYTTACGKTAHVRVLRVGKAVATELRTWGAHEHISVTRAGAEEGKR